MDKKTRQEYFQSKILFVACLSVCQCKTGVTTLCRDYNVQHVYIYNIQENPSCKKYLIDNLLTKKKFDTLFRLCGLNFILKITIPGGKVGPHWKHIFTQ